MRRLLCLILTLAILLPGTAFAVGHFTLPDCDTASSTQMGDTCFQTTNNAIRLGQRWYVFDGSSWIDCPSGACALATKSYCDPQFTTSVGITGATAVDHLLVAGVAGSKVTVCGGYVLAAGTVAMKFVRSTGATCAGTDANISEAIPLIAQVGVLIPVGIETTAGDSFCMNLAQAVAVTGVLVYRQAP
jgi:hypothetical protein